MPQICFTIIFLPLQIIENPQILIGRTSGLFSLICFYLLMYYSLPQIGSHFENKDSSAIAYKPFNLREIDKYPTFSICFKGPERYWFNEEFLFDKAGVSSAQFVKVLKGTGERYNYNRSSRTFVKEPVDLNTLSENEWNQLVWHPSDFIHGVDLVTEPKNNSVFFGGGRFGSIVPNIPLEIGYQTPEEICFTRKSLDSLEVSRSFDILSLTRSLLRPGNHRHLELRILIHYPGQLLRSFDKPKYRSTLESYVKDRLLELQISDVTTLRKRSDSNVRCNESLSNDDDRIRQEIIKEAGCIPPYWRKTIPLSDGINVCRLPEQLKDVSKYIDNYKYYLSTYDPPCVEMTTMVTVNKDSTQKRNEFKIKFTYTENVYQEIVNSESFDFTTCFSGVGGFVGIFLGFSLRDMPNILSNIPGIVGGFRFLKKIFTECNNSLL